MKRIVTNSIERLPLSQLVNIVGKYVYKNINGGYEFKKRPNIVDMFFNIPCQYVDNPESSQISVNINVTTYQDKLRVNLVEVSSMERTLGYFTVNVSKFADSQDLCKSIMNKIHTKLDKSFSDCTILY